MSDPPFFSASHFTQGPPVYHFVYHGRPLRGGRSLLRYRRTFPCGKAGMKTREQTLGSEEESAAWQDGPHERPGRRRGTGAAAGEGGAAAARAASLPLPELRSSELPERLSPVR